MQQTEKYKFNLIEMEDDFSPEPLNENARAVEEQFLAVEAAAAAQEQRLNQSIGAQGRTCRIEMGSYTGTGGSGSGKPSKLTFSIYPLLVYVAKLSPRRYCFFGRDETGHLFGSLGSSNTAKWEGHTLTWYANSNNSPDDQLNESGVKYHWLAIGYDDSQE